MSADNRVTQSRWNPPAPGRAAPSSAVSSRVPGRRKRLGGALLALIFFLPLALAAKEGEAAKVEVSGVGWLGDRELRSSLERMLGSERGPTLDANAIEDAMFLLMSAVQDDGFLKPVIRVEMTDAAQKKLEVTLDVTMAAEVPRDMRAVEVHFKVDRGVRYFLDEVKLADLTAVPAKTAEAFFVGESTLLAGKSSRIYTPGRLARAVDSVAGDLRQRGYAEADVSTSEVQVDEHSGAVRVTVQVREGPMWKVASVDVTAAAATGIDAAALQRFVGQPWSESVQQDAAAELRRLFYAKGYPDARVAITHAATPAADGHKDVAVVARVRAGEAVTLGRVRFEGAGDVRESVLRRRVKVQSGEPLNVLEFEQARYRIARLGVFDRVDLDYTPDTGAVRDAVFAVQPGRRLEVNALGGYGSYEQLRAGLEVRQYNLFGHAHQARGLFVQSMKSTRGEYSYTVPEIFGESIDGTAKIFGLQRDEVAFQRQEWGGSLAASAPIGRLGVKATAGYTIQSLRSGDNELETKATDASAPVIVASADFGLTRDRRDNPLNPRHGYRWFAQVEAASRKLGGEAEYQRLEFGGAYHTVWGSGRWWHFNLAHGVITTWGTTDQLLPPNKRFFPGGDGSIRGFQTGEAAPRGADGRFIGAKSYMLGSVELEQLLAPKWSVVAFGDALGTTTQLKRYPFDETLFAVGAGVRYQTLIGPIRVEYGHNLKRRLGDPAGTWLVSIGFPF